MTVSETRRLAVSPLDGGTSYGVSGDTYTILLTGADTAGRYALIHMRVPVGGGPPPHRHGFEELFAVFEGEVEVWCGSEHLRAGPGAAVNVPAGVPHKFRNPGPGPLHMLCVVAPAGLEAMFAEVGMPLADRRAPAPPPGTADPAERGRMADAARRHGIEFLAPDLFEPP